MWNRQPELQEHLLSQDHQLRSQTQSPRKEGAKIDAEALRRLRSHKAVLVVVATKMSFDQTVRPNVKRARGNSRGHSKKNEEGKRANQTVANSESEENQSENK